MLKCLTVVFLHKQFGKDEKLPWLKRLCFLSYRKCQKPQKTTIIRRPVDFRFLVIWNIIHLAWRRAANSLTCRYSMISGSVSLRYLKGWYLSACFRYGKESVCFILVWNMSLVWKPFLVVHLEHRFSFSWFYFKRLEDSTTCISVLSFRCENFVILQGLWGFFALMFFHCLCDLWLYAYGE